MSAAASSPHSSVSRVYPVRSRKHIAGGWVTAPMQSGLVQRGLHRFYYVGHPGVLGLGVIHREQGRVEEGDHRFRGL